LIAHYDRQTEEEAAAEIETAPEAAGETWMSELAGFVTRFIEDHAKSTAPMKNKTPKKMRGPTLQEFELVPVTDPAELAKLDRRCREAEKALAAGRNPGKRKSPKRR
jgi:hypothetical protein